MSKKTTVLMILDGFGLNDRVEGNAIKQANTPVIDKLMAECPFEKGYASGLAVGLPDGQMGNSEVGHLNMGAGRIIYQDLTKITKAIEDGDFFTNEALMDAVNNCKENNSSLHLYGLLSPGGVHSHLTHVYALLKLAKMNGLEKVYVHCFLDGRDTPPASARGFIAELEEKMKEIGVGKVATISAESYKNEVYDEFVVPTVIIENGKPTATIKENDSIIFFNFRPDRAREITRCFCDVDFKGFERVNGYFPVKYVCFTDYDVTIENKEVAFKKEEIKNTLGEYLASKGLTQARIAETEKYAHVTFFFNGGVEEPNKGEDRILVPSPKVATYDLQPEMSAPAVTDKLVEAIESGKYDVIIINYANPDMVGHTGVMEAAIKAVETVDACVGRAVESLKKVDGQMFLCADHGNSDQLVDYETGKPFTAHTTNPVPFILVNCKKAKGLMEDGKLCDIAPTLLDMMDMEQPEEMTGHSLLIK